MNKSELTQLGDSLLNDLLHLQSVQESMTSVVKTPWTIALPNVPAETTSFFRLFDQLHTLPKFSEEVTDAVTPIDKSEASSDELNTDKNTKRHLTPPKERDNPSTKRIIQKEDSLKESSQNTTKKDLNELSPQDLISEDKSVWEEGTKNKTEVVTDVPTPRSRRVKGFSDLANAFNSTKEVTKNTVNNRKDVNSTENNAIKETRDTVHTTAPTAAEVAQPEKIQPKEVVSVPSEKLATPLEKNKENTIRRIGGINDFAKAVNTHDPSKSSLKKNTEKNRENNFPSSSGNLHTQKEDEELRKQRSTPTSDTGLADLFTTALSKAAPEEVHAIIEKLTALVGQVPTSVEQHNTSNGTHKSKPVKAVLADTKIRQADVEHSFSGRSIDQDQSQAFAPTEKTNLKKNNSSRDDSKIEEPALQPIQASAHIAKHDMTTFVKKSEKELKVNYRRFYGL